MTYNLLTDLTESRMFPSKKSFENLDYTVLTEGAYIHILALRILLTEDITFAKRYIKKAISTGNFKNWRADSNDLYLHCFGLQTGQYEAVGKEPEIVSMVPVMRWLKEMDATKGLDESETNRFFLRMDRLFGVTDSSLRAVRRLVMDWPTLTEHEKKLSSTRLLQIMRARTRKSDLLSQIEKHARKNDWEMKDVCDAETGDGCDATPAKPERMSSGYKDPLKRDKAGLLTALAGIGIGAAAGYALVRDKRIEESDGGTSAANVAAVAKPLDGQALGPGFGGTDQGVYGKKNEAVVLRREPPTTIVVEQPWPSKWKVGSAARIDGSGQTWQVFRETAPEGPARRGELIRREFTNAEEASFYARGLNEGLIVDAAYSKIFL